MRRILLFVILAALATGGCAGTAIIRRAPLEELVLAEIPEPKPYLTVGEKLTFRAAWKGISIGRGTAFVSELTKHKGYDVYKVVVKARTNAFLSKLFRVDDTFTSYIDKHTLTTRGFEGIIREGRYKKDVIVDFDFEKNIASYTNTRDGTVKTAPIEKDIHDPISAAYSFRTSVFKGGEKIRYIVNLNEKNYEIIVNIGDMAKITIPGLGSFNAFLVEPYVRLGGKRQNRGKAWGYITADEKRIPPFVAVRVLEIPWIGQVTATLENVEYVSP